MMGTKRTFACDGGKECLVTLRSVIGNERQVRPPGSDLLGNHIRLRLINFSGGSGKWN